MLYRDYKIKYKYNKKSAKEFGVACNVTDRMMTKYLRAVALSVEVDRPPTIGELRCTGLPHFAKAISRLVSSNCLVDGAQMKSSGIFTPSPSLQVLASEGRTELNAQVRMRRRYSSKTVESYIPKRL